MSVYLYEDAIVEKMRKIVNDDRFIITPSDNINNVIPRIKKDELKLPLIFMTRTGWGLTSQRHHGLKMNGHIANEFPLFNEFEGIDECEKIKRVHAIPIKFSHTFTVLTRTREENDNIMRELIWLFATDPNFEIIVPYTLNMPHIFVLDINSDITDQSEIGRHPDIGEYFSQSFSTTCNDAYLWKSSEHNPTCVHINGQLQTNYETINTMDYNNLSEEERR